VPEPLVPLVPPLVPVPEPELPVPELPKPEPPDVELPEPLVEPPLLPLVELPEVLPEDEPPERLRDASASLARRWVLLARWPLLPEPLDVALLPPALPDELPELPPLEV
jgi:hypothetical protein